MFPEWWYKIILQLTMLHVAPDNQCVFYFIILCISLCLEGYGVSAVDQTKLPSVNIKFSDVESIEKRGLVAPMKDVENSGILHSYLQTLDLEEERSMATSFTYQKDQPSKQQSESFHSTSRTKIQWNELSHAEESSNEEEYQHAANQHYNHAALPQTSNSNAKVSSIQR